jgi:NAD(P)H-dependent flavin oxidoreductase YrpB (nitropropane dioxygenase family)
MKPLRIGDLVAPLPLVQGGMGVAVSLSGLAAAVANEGGIGVIATPGIALHEPDMFANFVESNTRALRKEIRKAREKSKGILGINLMVALSNFGELANAAIEEGIDVIFSGAGLPLNLPEYLRSGCKTKLVPIVSSARAAAVIMKRWLMKYRYPPDALVVEGPLAGGHIAFTREQIGDPAYALEKIFPEVLTEARRCEAQCGKPIPVIAAGGIWSGADIYRFLQMGAAGVQMATRFVTTVECDASPAFKEAYLRAKPEDIVIIDSPLGMPGRAIRNAFLDDVARGVRKPFKCPYHCIITCDYKHSPYCIAFALVNAKKGNLQNGFAFCGANAYRAKEIVTVKQLIATLLAEYAQAARSG